MVRFGLEWRGMKAALYENYGSPNNVELKNIQKPEPKQDEILIKVSFAGVNRTDCGFLRGKPFIVRFFSGFVRPKRKVLGCEFAGTVEKAGTDVKEFKTRDKVFGFDDVGFGAHAEYMAIPEKRMIAKIPDKTSMQQAAASSEGAHYALSYVWVIKPKPGMKVFVHGATGSIGSAAVQFLKHYGAYVVASSTTKNIDLIKSLGADKVIDWQKQDISKQDQKFDVVFDAVGKSSIFACKPIIKNEGTYIATELGKYGQNPLLAMINPLQRVFTGRNVLSPLPKSNKKVIEFIQECLAKGDFKPVLDKSYSLEEIVQAYNYVETGEKTGNVTVKIQ